MKYSYTILETCQFFYLLGSTGTNVSNRSADRSLWHPFWAFSSLLPYSRSSGCWHIDLFSHKSKYTDTDKSHFPSKWNNTEIHLLHKNNV